MLRKTNFAEERTPSLMFKQEFQRVARDQEDSLYIISVYGNLLII